MTNRAFKPLLLEGAQPFTEDSHQSEPDHVAYDEDLMMMVDTRTRVPTHRSQAGEASDTRRTLVHRETTDDE